MSDMLAADDLPAVLANGMHTFTTPRPVSTAAWETQKPRLRETLWRLLGDLPPRKLPAVTLVDRQVFPGYSREHFSFDNGLGDTVYGYLLIPAGHTGRGPAVLYHHYHGGAYAQGKEELFRTAFREMGNADLVTGPELVRAGYVVLAVDAYGFGERQFQGPGGKADGNATEASLAKTFLWQGRSLWGMIVHDDRLALEYLLSRPEVDPQRVAALGMSMGSTRSWWLAALDERIHAVVSVACLTRYQDLLADGNLRFHGIYFFVPGVLRERIDMEAVIGLIAPRPHLTLTGAADTGSPTSGVRTIGAFQEHLYGLYGQPECYRGVLYPGLGHVYSPAMWQETLAWLKRWLR